MRIILFILFLTISAPISAKSWTLIGSGEANVVGEESIIIDTTSMAASNTTELGSVNAKGQGFTLPSTKHLTKICIVPSTTKTNRSITIRVGTSNNLNSYIEEVSGTIQFTADTPSCVTFSGANALTGGVKYYFGVLDSQTGNFVRYSSASEYSGGGYATASTGWSMGSESSTIDLHFQIWGR